ncbi:MAG: hypothetical protein AB1483_01370 [Candidatus Zixiibacteriota bacterium]
MTYQPPPRFFKNPGLAAVFSFFYMGLGQIYNGQIAKGILFIVAYTISWLFIASIILLPIGIISTPVLFIYGMYDAYKSAEKINRDIASQPPHGSGPAVN